MQQIRNFILFLGLWLTSLVAQAQQILPFSQHFETGSRTIFCTVHSGMLTASGGMELLRGSLLLPS